VGCLLGTIATDSHAAPSSAMPFCLIEEEEDAVVTLACLDIPKVCRGNEFGNLLGNG
jgi:hypothetical protein